MRTFRYQARDSVGVMIRGQQRAESKEALALDLRSRNLELVRIAEQSHTGRRSGLTLPRKQLPQMLRDLATLDESGVPLLAGLEDIHATEPGGSTSKVAGALMEGLNHGRGLAETMADHPRAFPREVIATTDAGEQSGSLASVLMRLADYLEWKSEVRSQARQALVYPCILLVAILGLVVLMLTFMIPRISDLFDKMSVPLPLPTRTVIGASDFLVTYWLPILGGAIGVLVAILLFARHPRGKVTLHRWILRAPIVGPILKKISAAQLCSSLSNLFGAGVPLTKALDITAEVVPNRFVGGLARRAQEQVVAGGSLAESLNTHGFLPPLVRRMVNLGETTGTLEESLERVVKVFDREVPGLVKGLVRLIEPLTIVGGGGVVAFMVIAAMLPMFRLIQSVK